MSYNIPKDALQKMIVDQLSHLKQYEIVEIANTLINSIDKDKYILVPVLGNNLKIIDIEHILYLFQPKKNIAKLYLITGEEISCKITTDDLWVHLEELMFFKQLDSGIMVNMDAVKWYDSELHKVYFSLEHCISVTGSAVKNIIIKKLGKELDLKYNKGIIDRPVYNPIT